MHSSGTMLGASFLLTADRVRGRVGLESGAGATVLGTICPLQASSIGICIASLPSALLLGCVAMNSDLPFADERFDHFRQHKLSLHLFFPNAESWPLCISRPYGCKRDR